MGSATHDWPGHVDSVSRFHTVFYKWRVLHLRKITFSRWFQQTLVLLKYDSLPRSRITPSAGMTSSPQFLKLIPFYVWMINNDVSRDGTCYLLIQIFGHFLLSEGTSSNTTSVSCRTTKFAGCMVIYWRNTFVSASSWEASKWLKSVSGLGDSVWMAPPPAKIVFSTGICCMSGKDDVSCVYFRMGYSFPFSRQGDDPTFRLESTPGLQERPDKKLSAKSPNTAACWAPASQ